MPDQNLPSTVDEPSPADHLTVGFADPALAVEFAPGTNLKGRYVVERTLGRGGMGQVYLGTDSVLQRAVAVKFIRPSDSRLRNRSMHEAGLREAFIREARIGAGLTHPAIATVFDFGFHDEEPFIVFEYIAGETLGGLLRRRQRLPLEEVRLVLGPLAQALDFAHGRHVVHRDLKPENIRSTAQGHFKILDLGLAEEFRKEIDWHFAGTPAYASPEQAANLPCDGRTDQYALALVAYEMLSGHRVFEHGNGNELLKLHREHEAPSLRTLVPDVPEFVDTTLQRALQKDPNSRFATCEEFAVALGCQLLNVPVPAPPIDRVATIRRMGGLWKSARYGLRSRDWNVYLVLAADSLWVAHREDIRRWPLRAIASLKRGFWGEHLTLRLRLQKHEHQQWFQFSDHEECEAWHDDLLLKKEQLTGDNSSLSGSSQIEPVPLMRRPPTMRFQTLGTVDFQNTDRNCAEIALQVRAALMSADAVVDVQEERLPQLGQTVHRRSGMAIKAVDMAGRQELRLRWFAGEVARLGYWMLMLVVVSCFGTIAGTALNLGEEYTGVWIRTNRADGILQHAGLVLLLIMLIHAWPLVIALMTRTLLWPQLLRPAALTMLVMESKPIAGLLGWLAAGVTSGRWVGGVAFFFSLLDPINVFLAILAWFIFRRTWRTHAQFRKLAPDGEKDIPRSRRNVESTAWAATSLFAAIIVPVFALSQFNFVRNFSGPGNDRWKEVEALRLFNAGIANIAKDQRQSERDFHDAQNLWRQLTNTAPDQPLYRHNLAATGQNLAMVFAQSGRIDEALNALQQSLADYAKLEAEQPRYQKHIQGRLAAQKALTALLARQRQARDAPKSE